MFRNIFYLILIVFVFFFLVQDIFLHKSYQSSSKTQEKQTFQRTRRNPTTSKPLVCLTFTSAGRPELLQRTVDAAIRHMETYETIDYEIVWADQGTNTKERNDIARMYQFNSRVFTDRRRGYIWSFNLVYHSLCTAPYVLTLEEDWEFSDKLLEGTQRKNVVEEAIELLKTLEEAQIKAYGVLLRWERDYFANRDPPVEVDTKVGKVKYIRSISKGGHCKAGAYTNGASVYRRSDLQEFGLMVHDGECEYSQRAFEKKYFMVSVWRKDSCLPKDTLCNSVVYHIGYKSATLKTEAFVW